MATIVGGNGTGLLDGSAALLNRNDTTRQGKTGNGEQDYVNVSNGNVVVQHVDAYLPSEGEDYSLVRTYNAQGLAANPQGHDGSGWRFSTSVNLSVVKDSNGSQHLQVEYGDGSLFEYYYDAKTGLYVSTDGAGAYESIKVVNSGNGGGNGSTTGGGSGVSYVLTRADQTKLSFNAQGQLLSSVDTNGVSMEFIYTQGRLTQVRDDTGHVINYVYTPLGKLHQVVDETGTVLVTYDYQGSNLTKVIDRDGHVTQYTYNSNGLLSGIELPDSQVVNGKVEHYQSRAIHFQYQYVEGVDMGKTPVVSQLTDAQGGVTTFHYDFQFTTAKAAGAKGMQATQTVFAGGTTTVVDALGNDRAFSNDTIYREWRVAHGYYEYYNAGTAATDPSYQAQVDAILQAHSLTYSYSSHGYLTKVIDQQGYETTYSYDANNDLTSVTDRNGYAAINSDSSYYRALRAELGYVDAAGNGVLVADLTPAQKAAILADFTTTYTYDDRGNMLSRRDNAGNLTTYTYTAFDKLASQTSAEGNALVSSDAPLYQQKRVSLGYAALVANLSAADKQAILADYTTTYQYDAHENLIERTDAGGAITRYQYDTYGNLTQRTVYTDHTDLTDTAKQEVTRYFYNAFGENIETIDAQGNTTYNTYDHFGNRIQHIDGNGGVTTYSYDKDNRLIGVVDAMGNTTTYRYDAVGNRIAVTDAAGHTIISLYDKNNLLIGTIDPSNTDPTQDRTTHYAYDVVGDRTQATDAEGRVTTYTYNARRQLVAVTSAQVAGADGTPTQYTTSYAYDGEGNRIRTVDNRGFSTDTLYNRDGLVHQTTDPTGHITRYVYDADNNRVEIIAGMELPAAKRQILRFNFDEQDREISTTDALGNVSTIAYDDAGNRIATTDANGNTTEYRYDHDNRLIEEIRPAVTDAATGASVRYTVTHQYDANGNEITTTDENGDTTRYTFNKDNKEVMVTDANGIQTVYTYDSRLNRTGTYIGVSAHVNASGNVVIDDQSKAQVTTYTYDEFNQVVATTDAVGNALVHSDAPLYQQMRAELGFTDASGNGLLVADLSAAQKAALLADYTDHYTYDRVGNQLTSTDHLGHVTTDTYDSLNRLASSTDALGETTTYRYDGNGNRVAVTDALGHTTTYAYDGDNRLTDTTDALGVDTHRTYDAFGNLSSSTQAAGTSEARTTRYVYDLDNRQIQQSDPQGNTKSYSYDAVGNRLAVTDGRGNTTHYVYDALNRNVKVIDPLGFQTRYEYDGVGNRLEIIDANGGVTKFTYDPGNRLIQTTDAMGRVTQYQYDVRGNRITQTTAAGTAQAEVTHYEYDAQNNLRAVTDANGNVTTHDYDRVYNEISTTDANGHTSHYVFDAVNRRIESVDANGAVTTYAYDAVGNQISVTDALGHVTSYAYDADNRQISQTGADGVVTQYAYDDVGNRVAITYAAGTSEAATTTFVYNKDDLLTAQTDAMGDTTRYAYDADQNRTLVTDANGNQTVYTYDADNRVSSITDALGNTTQYRYDGNGNRTQVIDARGYITTTYYNADNEKVMSVDADGYATAYAYDANGNVTSQTLYANALTLPVDPATLPTPTANAAHDETVQYGYDKVNQLVSRTDAEGYLTTYSYDAVGNRIQSSVYLDKAATEAEVTHTYYDAVNRRVASLSAEGYLTEFTYDAVGNQTSRTYYNQRIGVPAAGAQPQPATGDPGLSTTYSYDSRNRLVSETNAVGAVTAYAYDARGNQIEKTVAAGTPDAASTEYRYDKANRLTDTINALGVVTHLQLDADGNILARYDAYGTAEQQVTQFAYDGDNRVIETTDALGIVTTNTYDASGNKTSTTTAAGLPDAHTATFEYDGNNHLIAQVASGGLRTEYAYDGAGNRIRTTVAPGLPEEQTNTFEYDRDNRQIAATDAMGVRTEYAYDGAGNKVETTQAVGIAGQERHSYYTYNADNRLTSVTDPMGGVTRYQYDVLGNQTRVIDANGGVRINTFDGVGDALTSLSAGGVLTTNTYDLRGNTVSTTQSWADGSDARTTTYGYDALNQKVLVTGPDGFSTSISYDDFGNQVSITHGEYLVAPSSADYSADKAARAFAQTNTFTYDADGRMLSTTDAEGNLTTYTYDAVGNRTSVTYAANTEPRTSTYTYNLANQVIESRTPEGGIVRYTYNAVGEKVAADKLQSVDAAGHQVWVHLAYEYDKDGHLTASIDPYGVRTEHTYDAMGNMLSTTTAAGTSEQRVVHMEYDLDNRKTADIDAMGNRTSYTYDAMGNRTTVTDALGHVAHYYYNGQNKLSEVVDPEGYVNTFKYDSAGNKTETHVYMTAYTGSIDTSSPPTPTPSGLDRITRTEYNGNNKAVVRIASDGTRTEKSYDGAGNLIKEVKYANTAAPRTMTYRYDRDNRLVKFTDVDGTITTFTYDGANNKTSQTVYNAADPNSTRTTTYTYDLNNHRIKTVFDPNGLDIVQTTTYDKLGNAVAKTDGNGVVTEYHYDLNNRAVQRIVDPGGLALTTTTTFDAVGNAVAVTDANGNTTHYTYDADNRVVTESQPAVDVYTIKGGLQTGVHPTTTHVYDAMGNEIQTIDPNGNVTTRYYDADNRMVAKVNGDNVLREYSYDATGDKTSETLYMTKLTATPNPSQLPTAPTGATRTTTYQYDLAGRLTKTTYPEAAITTLSNTAGAEPTATTVSMQPTETKQYDAYGNLVVSTDKNGNRTVNYYDVKGNKIATVDPQGYLTQYTYDDQGNILEQRVYTQALDPANVDPSTLPTPPAGEVYVTTRSYDAANRLVKEQAPAITVTDPTTKTTSVVRPTTVYTYDQDGNRLTKTIGAGTAKAITDYSYYDAANRRVAVINGDRVVNAYQYDADGNVTEQSRYYNAVSKSVDLASLTGSTDFTSLVSPDPSHDETTFFTYDALNRVTSQSDKVGGKDLTKTYHYNATDRRTYAENEGGYVTQSAYNAAGEITQTISPDGSGTMYEYDAAGKQIYTYTGVMTNRALPATNLGATLTGSGLTLSWDVPGADNTRSWVVYGTSSHTNISDYANRTSVQTSNGKELQAILPAALSGQSVYVRVVSEDIAGNLTWTGESKITIPPRFSGVSVTRNAAGELQVHAQFDAGAEQPVLDYGAPGSTTNSVAFVEQADGSYTATLSGVSDAQSLAYRLQWQDAAGHTFQSNEIPFAGAANHTGDKVNLTQGQVADSNGTLLGYTITAQVTVPTSVAQNFNLMEAAWRPSGSSASFALTGVSAEQSANGYTTYDLTLGSSDQPLQAGDYQVVLRGVRADGTRVSLNDISYTVGTDNTALSQSDISWDDPRTSLQTGASLPKGDSQFVVVNGQVVSSSEQGGRIVVDPNLDTSAAVPYSVYYTQEAADTHNVGVTSTPITQTSGNPPVTTITGYNLGVSASFSDTEVANMSGGLHLAWRAAGTGAFTDVSVPSSGTDSFATTLSNLAAGQYDLKLYYTDAQGHQVVVQWERVDTASASDSFTGKSQTVLAAQTGGTLALDANNMVVQSPGLYVGSVTGDHAGTLTLGTTATGLTGGSQSLDKETAGYYVETVYNALGDKIATNANDGLWRKYLVDANGNAVEQRLYGTDRNATSYVATYTAYDARNRKVAHWGASVTDPATGTMTRPVTRYTYNVLDKVTSETNPLGDTMRYTYNALGTKISDVDAYGQAETYGVDVYGHVVSDTSRLGDTSYKFYDAEGRLIRKTDATGRSTTYTYDTFDRKVSMTDGRGDVTTYAYDQRDRLISVTDAMHGVTRYAYDGRNDRTMTEDANGHKTFVTYDSLGRVSTTTTLLSNGKTATATRSYDAYGNLISKTNADNQTTHYIYNAFSQLHETIDPDGNQTYYQYNDLGQMVHQSSVSVKELTVHFWGRTYTIPASSAYEYDVLPAQNIDKTYDNAGHVQSIVDHATGVSTYYTYDLDGHVLTEKTTTPGDAHDRNLTYQYDKKGELVRWKDSVTGLNMNYVYDADGNLQRAFTDLGYDPTNVNPKTITTTTTTDKFGKEVTDTVTVANPDYNPNYRYVDHVYHYDAAGRLTELDQETVDASGNVTDKMIDQYGYDAAGNRITWDHGNVSVAYTYDADNRVSTGDWSTGGKSYHQSWSYDKVGNVLDYKMTANGNLKNETTNQYDARNLSTYTYTQTAGQPDQTTDTTYDAAGRQTQMVLHQNGKTYTYDYTYYGDGRQRYIWAFGAASGNSYFTYNADKVETRVDLGQGDQQNHPEYKTFVVDNSGHILYQYHDTGKTHRVQTGTSAFGNTYRNVVTTESYSYVYADGHPVGQTGHDTKGNLKIKLDTGKYSLFKNLSDTDPASTPTTYTVQSGDTLQGIAAAVYGNPSLWFVLAAANGLSAGETLKAGTVLEVPNNIKTGRITANTHTVYDANSIIGSSLPNLKSPPPPSGGCGGLLSIIIIVVIAVVAWYAVGFLATTVFEAGTTLTAANIALWAAAGAIVGAAASIVQQGIFIALGYQKKFSWKDVAAGAIAGAFGGAARGVTVAAGAGNLVENSVSYTKVAAAALKVASVASKQEIENGKITSWTSLASAALSGASAVGKQFGTYMKGVAKEVGALGDKGIAATLTTIGKNAITNANTLSNIATYATPWAQLAETYARTGKLTPGDWAGAVGATLSQEVHVPGAKGADKFSVALENTAAHIGTDVLVAGATSLFSRADAQSYLVNSVGNEIGQFIGQEEILPALEGSSNVKAAAKRQKQAAKSAPPPGASSQAAHAGTQQSSVNSSQSAGATNSSAAQTYPVQSGDSLWKIATRQLGPGATNTQIQDQVLRLMAANPGIDPMHLQPGKDVLNLVGKNYNASTVAAYDGANAQYVASKNPVPAATSGTAGLGNTAGLGLGNTAGLGLGLSPASLLGGGGSLAAPGTKSDFVENLNGKREVLARILKTVGNATTTTTTLTQARYGLRVSPKGMTVASGESTFSHTKFNIFGGESPSTTIVSNAETAIKAEKGTFSILHNTETAMRTVKKFSPFLAKTGEILGGKVFGGAFTAASYLPGDIKSFNAGKMSGERLAIASTVDFLAGAGITVASDTAGTVAGSAASETGPGALVVGYTVHQVASNFLTSEYQQHRTAIINHVVNFVNNHPELANNYRRAINYTATNIMPTAVHAYNDVKNLF